MKTKILGKWQKWLRVVAIIMLIWNSIAQFIFPINIGGVYFGYLSFGDSLPVLLISIAVMLTGLHNLRSKK